MLLPGQALLLVLSLEHSSFWLVGLCLHHVLMVFWRLDVRIQCLPVFSSPGPTQCGPALHIPRPILTGGVVGPALSTSLSAAAEGLKRLRGTFCATMGWGLS